MPVHYETWNSPLLAASDTYMYNTDSCFHTFICDRNNDFRVHDVSRVTAMSESILCIARLPLTSTLPQPVESVGGNIRQCDWTSMGMEPLASSVLGPNDPIDLGVRLRCWEPTCLALHIKVPLSAPWSRQDGHVKAMLPFLPTPEA